MCMAPPIGGALMEWKEAMVRVEVGGQRQRGFQIYRDPRQDLTGGGHEPTN